MPPSPPRTHTHRFAISLIAYCKSGNFRENLILADTLKDILAIVKISLQGYDLPISVVDSDFAISRGFYFHETSHMRSFAKIKPSRKFPNLQYPDIEMIKSTILAQHRSMSDLQGAFLCRLLKLMFYKYFDYLLNTIQSCGESLEEFNYLGNFTKLYIY